MRYGAGEWPLTEEYRSRVDGVMAIYEQEVQEIDLYNPQTQREEYTMWHFCNNHDQWRMQAQNDTIGLDMLKKCLGWLTFWPGVPLHYAGDEQAFRTYGTALDGWAREELTLSAAWRGMGDTIPRQDNFDMSSQMYRYVQLLNRLRATYLDIE
eukprot:3970011-Prymnesium_polylepis.1